MRVLVAGATGLLGTEICRRALERGHEIHGLFRDGSDPERVEGLRTLGVELRQADLTDPSCLPGAVREVDAVVSTVTAVQQRVEGQSLGDVDGEGQQRLVDAAARSGVTHFVYVSYSGNIGSGDTLTEAKRSTERKLRSSGLTYTILRPSFFMEVWLSPMLGFDYPNARAVIYGDGGQPISWIALGDVAEFAAAALEQPAARDAMMEIGGPEPLTPLEVIRIFEQETGRAFAVEHVSEASLREEARTAASDIQRTFAQLKLSYAGGDLISMERTVARFGISLTTVRDYARSVSAETRQRRPSIPA